MTEMKEQFLLQEAAATRELIRTSIAEARTLERYCLVATAGVWTWLLTKAQSETVSLGYWIPLAVACLALIRVAALYFDVGRAAKYLRDVEIVFLKGEVPEGWETRVNPTDKTRLPIAAGLFWALLLLATLLAPFLIAADA